MLLVVFLIAVASYLLTKSAAMGWIEKSQIMVNIASWAGKIPVWKYKWQWKNQPNILFRLVWYVPPLVGSPFTLTTNMPIITNDITISSPKHSWQWMCLPDACCLDHCSPFIWLCKQQWHNHHFFLPAAPSQVTNSLQVINSIHSSWQGMSRFELGYLQTPWSVPKHRFPFFIPWVFSLWLVYHYQYLYPHAHLHARVFGAHWLARIIGFSSLCSMSRMSFWFMLVSVPIYSS